MILDFIINFLRYDKNHNVGTRNYTYMYNNTCLSST